jgi:cytochrome c oxidase subunit III
MTEMTMENPDNLIKPSMHKYTLATGISIISMSMLFMTLFLSFWILKVSAKVWPPLGYQNLSLITPVINTLVILLSSIFLVYSIKALNVLDLKEFKINFQRSFNLGILFTIVQGYFWYSLYSTGIYFKSGILGSIVYTYTIIHCAHVVLGICALMYVFKYFKVNHIDFNQRTLIKSIATFWHFLAIVWGLTFIHLVFIKI